MKMLKVLGVAVALQGLSLTTLALETAQVQSQENTQPACHLKENLKTEYCQNIMFPPIPFR